MKSITVCVEYDDLLAITLPRNRHLFERTVVVTSHADERTQRLVEACGCECHVTDAFYRHGAHFNKGAAMEEGFDVLGRDGWIVIWDADILMPSSIDGDYEPDCLYSPVRHLLEDATRYRDFPTPEQWETLTTPTRSHEFNGYFQLFRAAAVKPPWYSSHSGNASCCDSDFAAKFSKRSRPLFTVLHLGPEGMPELNTRVGRNWAGRVTPRIDTGEVSPKAQQRWTRVQQLAKTVRT